MIRNIVFDMGNVLLEFNPERYLQKYVEREDDRLLLRRELFGNVEWVRTDHGTITEEDAARGVCARVPERLHAAVRAIFDRWQEDMPPFPEMEPLLRELKAAGYGLYVLSNVSHRYAQIRRGIPALELFDGEFISSDWHLVKPDPEIYRVFCLHFSLVPSTCFFVDDRGDNVVGALRAGMRGAVHTGDVAALRCRMREAGIEIL